MRSSRYAFRYKIGVSNNVGLRRSQVDKSMKGKVGVIFSIPIYGAYKVEALLHAIYSPLNVRMHGSGKTEWFIFLFPLTPIILLITIFILQLIGILLFIGTTMYLCAKYLQK